jgi:DNA-binding MarR family transcriptional regulator
MVLGRPPFDRQRIFDAIVASPRCGRRLVVVSANQIARQLDCHPTTVTGALDQFVTEGRLRRRHSKGQRGWCYELGWG